MRKRMLKLAACFLALGIAVPGQAVVTVCAEEGAVVVVDGANAQETASGTEQQTTAQTEQQTAAQTEHQTAAQTETEAAKKKKKKKKKKKAAQTETPAAEDLKGQMIFAQCEDHINIRKGPGTESEVVGKIYDDCMANVLSQDGEWLEIQSGNAVGFVKREYFVTGAEAQLVAEKVGYHVATIYAEELNVRATPDDDAEVIGVAYKGEELEAVSYENDWIQVCLGDEIYGYVNAYYAGFDTYYPEAETLEEEEARLEAERAQEEYVEEPVPEETYAPTSDSGSQSSWTAPVQTQTQTAPVQTEAPAETEKQTEAPAETEAKTEAPAETEAPTEAPATEAPVTEAPADNSTDSGSDDMYYDVATDQMVPFSS